MRSGRRTRRARFGVRQPALSGACYGFISEWSVEYTHWTTSMVPIRAVVSVSFTMLPAPAATDPNAQATWKDAATLQGNYTSGFLSASVTSVAQARAAGG